MKSRITWMFCLLLTCFFTNAQVTRVIIPGSQVQKVTSRIVPQQEYELQIMLPASHGKSNKRYPVVYLMDSQWDFPLVTSLYGQQYYDGFVPELIIIGVTWTGKNAKPDSLRVRDYVPTHNKQLPQSGGAASFLSFLKQELFPYIERRYNIDTTNRTLMGCSFGGLFTLFALFTEPGLFQNYVAATPAVSWDNESIYQFERMYANSRNNPPARVYMCVGGVERDVPIYQKLATHLKSRYHNLQLKSQVLENIGHSGTKGEGYERGLQFAFERPTVQLKPAQLKNILGSYHSENGHQVTIKSEGSQLLLDFGRKNRFVLKVANETEWYSNAEFLKLHFSKDENGNITTMEVERYGGTLLLTKIK